MRKRTLYTARDAAVVETLRRVLEGTTWTFKYQVPFAFALDDSGDDLSATERQRYREGVFPFVLYPGDAIGHEPVLAIELVPEGVLSPRFAAAAILTARFCRDAELPLLRIGADALNLAENTSVFEWIAGRIVRWGIEGAERSRRADDEMRVALEEQPHLPEEAIEDVMGDFDPHFWFDIEHPFPGLAMVAERLRTRFGIRVTSGHVGYADVGEGAPYEVAFPRSEGGVERTLIGEYETRTPHAVLSRTDSAGLVPLAEVTGSARFARAHLVVPPERANDLLEELYGRGRPDEIWGVVTAWMQIFNFQWPQGVVPAEIVRDISMYRALRAVELWAEVHLPLAAATS